MLILFLKYLVVKEKKHTFASVLKTASRGGAVVARWAHNPKAGGSIPSPATFKERCFSPFFIFNYRYFVHPALIAFFNRQRLLLTFLKHCCTRCKNSNKLGFNSLASAFATRRARPRYLRPFAASIVDYIF